MQAVAVRGGGGYGRHTYKHNNALLCAASPTSRSKGLARIQVANGDAGTTRQGMSRQMNGTPGGKERKPLLQPCSRILHFRLLSR